MEWRKLLQIYTYKRNQKVRIGRNNDGGYVIINNFGKYDGLISYGVSDDCSFEKQFQETYNCPVFMFDHTIKALPEQFPQSFFYKQGVADKKLPLLDTVENHIKMSGLQNSNNLFLKMDVEGAEWNVFDKMTDDTLLHFKQIVVEFHFPLNINQKIVKNVFSKLQNHFYIVHIHANNYDGPAGAIIINGIVHPNVFELTMIRKNCIHQDGVIPSTESFPIQIDQKNIKNKQDIILGTFNL